MTANDDHCARRTDVTVAAAAKSRASSLGLGAMDEKLEKSVLPEVLVAATNAELDHRLFVRAHALLYGASNGKIATTMRGHPILLLTTRGAKTSRPRQVPIVPMVEGDNVYVIASLGGAPSHPAWCYNLKASPDVEVQWFADKYRARAEILPEPERSRVWERVVAAMPGFADYQKKTSRVIPVVQLVRV